MIEYFPADLLLCLRCGQSEICPQQEGLICRGCGITYPVIDDIPMLVGDLESHLDYINISRVEKPDWYEGVQTHKPEDDVWMHMRRLRYALLAELFRKHIPASKTIVELGCGDGANLKFLKTLVNRVIGTDYNMLRLARASRAGGYDALFMSDLRSLPLADKSCEVVYFDQVLEHISDPAKALASVHRILKDTGILVLGVPNEGCWYHQLKFYVKPSLRKKTDHVNFFTEQSLSELLEQSGFVVWEARGMGWGLPFMSGKYLRPVEKMEMLLRRYRWYNKLWESLGSWLLPGQFFELYLVCSKSPSPACVK